MSSTCPCQSRQMHNPQSPNSRIIINNRIHRIIQANRISITGLNTRVPVQPAQDLLVPDEAVFGFLHPGSRQHMQRENEYLGLETYQWNSSGKFMKRLGMPRSWRTLKRDIPSETGRRKSLSFWMTSMGVPNWRMCSGAEGSQRR